MEVSYLLPELKEASL